MNLESFPLLSSIVLLPLIGALMMPFLSSKEGEDNTPSIELKKGIINAPIKGNKTMVDSKGKDSKFIE